MTNFSGATQKRSFQWISPERAVLVLPVLGGLALGLVVLSAIVLPLSVQLKQQQEELELIEIKSGNVPMLRQKLAQLATEQRQRQGQQERLLALVAGTSQLSTFLAELNDLSLKHRVVITATEPGPITRFVPPPPPSPANQAAPPSSAGATQAKRPLADGLLNSGVEKRSAQLKVSGGFPDVYGFLQALERLQVFVVISDLDVQQGLEGSSLGGTAVAEETAPSVVTMTFTVTAYGRADAPAKVEDKP